MAILRDGYKSLISFSLLAAFTGDYEEIELSLPELDGRGGIDQTSMRNINFTTELPKTLVTFGEFSGVMMYSPEFYAALSSRINRNQLMTITLPDGATVEFWGWINKATPSSYKEGERPTLAVNFRVSNIDNTCTETAPVITYGVLNPCDHS